LSHCIFDGVHRQHTAHVEPGVNRDMGPRRPLETRELLSSGCFRRSPRPAASMMARIQWD
jgi:hypothetical protein